MQDTGYKVQDKMQDTRYKMQDTGSRAVAVARPNDVQLRTFLSAVGLAKAVANAEKRLKLL